MITVSPTNMFTRAAALLQAGDTSAAIGLLRSLLAIVPAHAEGLHLLGLIQRRLSRVAPAEVLMTRALRSDPRLAVAHMNLAFLHEDAGRVERAEVHLRRLLAFEPVYGPGRKRLGTLLLGRGAIDEADAVFRRMGVDGTGDERTPLRLELCAAYRRARDAAADPSLPQGLVVRGVFRDGSGYAHKTRQFVRHLVAAGVPVHLIDLLYQPTRNLDDSQIDPLFRALDRPVRAKGILHLTTPPFVDRLPGFKTVNYSVIETTRIQPQWVEHSRRHDRVILATQSSADAWTSSGCPAERIALCPEGVEAVDAATIRPITVRGPGGRLLESFSTRILNVSDFTPRKNLTGLLRAWFKATRRNDDAALILKIGKDSTTSGAFATLCRDVSRDLGVAVDEAAPIFLIDHRLSDAEMLSLYAAATHYWSMSHGEGWDLPMAQAGAMGLTLLAPRHSAYTAYLDDRIAHFIPAPVTTAYGPYAGYDWWTPDEGAAVELIRRIIRAPTEHRRSARGHLLRHFSWEQATRRLIGLLEECGAL